MAVPLPIPLPVTLPRPITPNPTFYRRSSINGYPVAISRTYIRTAPLPKPSGPPMQAGTTDGQESADRRQILLDIPPELAHLVLNEPHHIIDMTRGSVTGRSFSAPPTPAAADHDAWPRLDLSPAAQPKSCERPSASSLERDHSGPSGDLDGGPLSPATRRKRNAKLSRFFGEAISADHPPPPLPAKKGGKEVLDGFAGEAWKALSAENARGKLKGAELERMREAIATMRRG